MSTVTEAQAEGVLALVAEWLGRKGYGTPVCPHGQELQDGRFWLHQDGTDCEDQGTGPAPTGVEAAHNGAGPMLLMDWDWPGGPTPTVLLEGGPYDWAIEVGEAIRDRCDAIGVWCEPYSGWALCVYPK